MRRFRLLLAARPWAVLWLVAWVLAVRMLVPAGFMPVGGPGGVALGLCPGAMSAPAPASAHAAMPGMHHGDGAPHEKAPADGQTPCGFAAAGLSALDVPDTVLVRAAPVLPFLVAPPLAPTLPATAAVRWRPPLRAPPHA